MFRNANNDKQFQPQDDGMYSLPKKMKKTDSDSANLVGIDLFAIQKPVEDWMYAHPSHATPVESPSFHMKLQFMSNTTQKLRTQAEVRTLGKQLYMY